MAIDDQQSWNEGYNDCMAGNRKRPGWVIGSWDYRAGWQAAEKVRKRVKKR